MKHDLLIAPLGGESQKLLKLLVRNLGCDLTEVTKWVG
jgi:hypothetical protein